MEQNNNQPLGVNPVAKPTVAPMQTQAGAPPSTPQATVPESPKGKNSKALILLVVLLVLVIGITAYVLLAQSQLNNTQKTTTNTSTVLPSPTLVPTLAPEEDLEVSDPEADLMEIDGDIKSL